MIKLTGALLVFNILLFSQQSQPELSITFDDPNTVWDEMMSWQTRDDAILKTLESYNIQAALFVCGMRIDNDSGRILLQKWNDKGHMICNHSYSHNYYHSKKISTEAFEYDFLRCDSIISKYSGYTKLFRFPYLKEGDSKEKRDDFRKFMYEHGYKNGSVTIDASDWYINGRMKDTLKTDINFDITPYKEYYLEHIYNRVVFYDSLAVKVTGSHIKNTLLLHHNLINALFIGDLIEMFISKGWKIVNASDAFSSRIFEKQPDIIPAGESLVWGLAKETGKYDNILRYPGEDGEYEEEGMNNCLKNFFK